MRGALRCHFVSFSRKRIDKQKASATDKVKYKKALQKKGKIEREKRRASKKEEMRNKATATAQSVLMQRNQGHKESNADCISNNRQIDGNFCNLRMLISMLKMKECGYKLFYA